MDQLDGRILAALKENGRSTASEISRQVSLSVPAVTERIRKMEHGGIIEKYTVRVNRKAMGYRLMAFIFVTIANAEQSAAFQERIVQSPSVLECHAIAGPSDYLLKVLVQDTDALDSFLNNTLRRAGNVANINTLVRLKTLKEEINIQDISQ